MFVLPLWVNCKNNEIVIEKVDNRHYNESEDRNNVNN